MVKHDCGCLPVVEDQDGKRVIGVVTDRDLVRLGVAEGKDSSAPVKDMMSDDPSCCSPDAGLDEVEKIMSERKVRRVPVVDGGGGCCVGIVAQADLARADGRVSDKKVGEVVERVSEPGQGERSDAQVGIRPARDR